MADKTGYRPEEVGAKRRFRDLGDGSFAEVTAPLTADNVFVGSVDATISSTTLRGANESRRGLLIFNDCNKALFLKYGSAASESDFSVKIAAGGYWEMPSPIYLGSIRGLWAAAPTGAARITELS